MDSVPLSYAAISFIMIIGCIGTCMLSKCFTFKTIIPSSMRENTVSSQTPPPYYNTATHINIQPPPYKFETSHIISPTYYSGEAPH